MTNSDKRPGISVNFVIKNGIIHGYPFWESLKSCLAFANELVISEGNSTDGTEKYLEKFVSMFGDQVQVRVYHDDWTAVRSAHGEVISIISERNQRRCRYEWIYYLQADEILHDLNTQFVKDIAGVLSHKFNSVSFPFCHFIGGWEPLPKGAAYDEAIRMVKNRHDITFLGDAWNFGGAVIPICPAGHCPRPVYHLGWVFPKNCDQKSVEHGKIYAGMQNYQKAAAAASERLAKGDYAVGLPRSDKLSGYPPCLDRLFGMVEYSLPPEAIA